MNITPMTDAMRLDNEDFDYEFDLRVVGVRIGDTGKTRWRIMYDDDYDSEYIAGVLEKVIEVLRQPNLEDE